MVLQCQPANRIDRSYPNRDQHKGNGGDSRRFENLFLQLARFERVSNAADDRGLTNPDFVINYLA
jgi:hypothetical protein